MFFSAFCVIVCLGVILNLKNGDQDNLNGLSVSILQKTLVRIHSWFLDHPKFSHMVFAYPDISKDSDLASRQIRIEKLVWRRLLIVSLLGIVTEGLLLVIDGIAQKIFAVPLITYIATLQFTLMLSLLRPLFGAAVDRRTEELDLSNSRKKTPNIPAPRRSLLMALVNFFEIILSWGLIYRWLMPDMVTSMDQANYFSVITLTTLGYGEINAGKQLLVQLAVTVNMIVFLVFSICHITTIMGAMSSGEDFDK